MKCIRIGYGHIAYWHEKKLCELGVKTAGVLDTSPAKRMLAESNGFNTLMNYHEAAALEPDFWDICSSTASHLDIIKNIIDVSPNANILVEKPVCLASQLAELKTILKNFKGKITVNENYHVSVVTQVIDEQIYAFDMSPTHVVSEMTKNRTTDIVNGRFLDDEHFALGYEGPHMLTNILALSDAYMPAGDYNVAFQDMHIDYPTFTRHLPKQGSVRIGYVSRNGAEITMYSSMSGEIGFCFPNSVYTEHVIPVYDIHTRYRILAVTDAPRDLSVVGYYEPIVNLPRATGMVMVIHNGRLKKQIGPIADDSMQLLMSRAIDYFLGKGVNPYSAFRAMHTLEILQNWQREPFYESH